MTVEFLELDNKQSIIDILLPMAKADKDHMIVCNDGSKKSKEMANFLKEVFAQFLKDKTIFQSWWNQQDEMEIHQDTEGTKTHIFYLKADDGKLIVDGKEYSVNTGDFVTYDSFIPHSVPAGSERIALIMEISHE